MQYARRGLGRHLAFLGAGIQSQGMNAQLDQIAGSVERVTYYNPENGYSVIRLQPDQRGMLPFKYASGRDALITVVGNLPEVNPGEWLKLQGRWSSHPRHGREFQVEVCEKMMPASLEGIKRYLGSGLVRGIGPVMAERIVNTFGERTLDVIDYEPARLREVLGIGQKRVSSIVKAWEEQRTIKDVMLFLQSHNVSTSLAIKIYKRYGDTSLSVVQNTPYKLVQDIHGVGFKTADKLAQALGLAHDDPNRIEAGIAYTLNRLVEEGHVYVPQPELEPEAAEILGLDAAKVSAVIEQLESDALIKRETLTYSVNQPEAAPAVREETAVYLTPFYYSEVGVTNRIQRLTTHPASRLARLKQRLTPTAFAQMRRQMGMELAAQQQEAIQTAINHKVTILTGGPGTGKTTTLRALLDLLDQGGCTYALAAPTGRAARRLAETTGRPAKTIHRLLEFKSGEGFVHDEENPLLVDMVIIDEASMLDLILANSLFKAVAVDSHVLLVGDVDQLPSVGAGDVLRDLIGSGVPAVVRLETIFRQAAGSLIIRNAHRINQGLMPATAPDEAGGDSAGQDFFLFVKQEPDEVAELVVDIVQNRAPHKFGLDPLADIQVLSPMYNGSAGVSNLNLLLQQALNPPGQRKVERRFGGRVFRVGDKVMQTVNNYDKNVFNGDIGRITEMDTVMQTFTVNMDGMPVVYDFLEADELVHAFAISVHKSQGSEYPCVVMPVVMQHYMMLQRNLLYTAVTRARKLVILVGTRRAISIAIKNNRVTERYTALDWRLRGKK
ncbi:MAG: ATP-dependent RecD-like DNA helicase [Candidatus Promineifilaceae bacterium]